jgi:hypothetical protein
MASKETIVADKAYQEAYRSDDPLIISIRDEFGYAVRRAIYESDNILQTECVTVAL